MPSRIQLKRTKGWRRPAGAIVVSRPSRWGNPWKVWSANAVVGPYGETIFCAWGESRGVAVRHFRQDFMDGRLAVSPDDLEELRGHDLACWCPLDQPCHADVLLELANS